MYAKFALFLSIIPYGYVKPNLYMNTF